MRLLLAAFACFLAAPALAQGPDGTPIQAGREYPGGTRVAAPAAGVSFVVPPSHVGGYDGEAQGFLIGERNHPNTLLGVYAFSEGTVDEIGQLVVEALIEMGIQLQPRGEPERNGNTLRASFHAVTGGGQGVLLGAVRGGAPGNTIAVVALGPPDDEGRAQSVLDAVLESARFTVPGAARWKAAVGGVRLSYLGQASTWSPGGVGDGSHASQREERYDFCSNGQYGYYMHSESYISVEGVGSASSESSDEHQGQWRLVGDIAGGAWLLLEATDGRIFEYQLEEREHGIVVGEDVYEASQSPLCR